MAKETNIEASLRSGTGKSSVKKIIATGKIPSILYGLSEKPVNIAIDKISIQKELSAGGFLTRIFNLNIDGEKN